MFKAMKVVVFVGALASAQLALAANCEDDDEEASPLTGLLECVGEADTQLDTFLEHLLNTVTDPGDE